MTEADVEEPGAGAGLAWIGPALGVGAAVLVGASVPLAWVRTTVRVDSATGLPTYGVPEAAMGFPLASTAPGIELWFGQAAILLAVVAILLLVLRQGTALFAVGALALGHALLSLLLHVPAASRSFAEGFVAELASQPSAADATVGPGSASPGMGALVCLAGSYFLFVSTAWREDGAPLHSRIAAFIGRSTAKIGACAAWLALGMVLIGAYNALARKLDEYIAIRLTSNALIEAQWYMFSLVFLLAAAWTLREGGHVRVDVFYGRLSLRGKAWLDLAGSVLFLLPFCAFAIGFSLPLVENSWATWEVSPDPGGLPRYPLKTVVPVAFLLVALQGHAEVIRCVNLLAGRSTGGASRG